MYKCHICGKETEGFRDAHILPESMGFKNSYKIAQCDCDGKVGDEEFVKMYCINDLYRWRKGKKVNYKRINKQINNKTFSIKADKDSFNMKFENGCDVAFTSIDKNKPIDPSDNRIAKIEASILPVYIYHSLLNSLILLEKYKKEDFLKGNRPIILQKLKDFCKCKEELIEMKGGRDSLYFFVNKDTKSKEAFCVEFNDSNGKLSNFKIRVYENKGYNVNISDNEKYEIRELEIEDTIMWDNWIEMTYGKRRIVIKGGEYHEF